MHENQMLEVKVPCLSVHRKHDPSSPADRQDPRPLPEVEEEKVKSYTASIPMPGNTQADTQGLSGM